MKKIFFQLAALLLIITSFTSSEEGNFNIGDKAPLLDYEMENINQEITTIETSKGANGIIVVFSCNTCPFVVGSSSFIGWEKQYNELYSLATENDLAFVLVNSNEAKREDDDSFDAMRAHAKSKGYKMNYLLDKNSLLANAFGAKTTPHVFVLNSDSQLIYKGSIDNTWDSKREKDIPYLKNAIAQIKSKQKISTTETAPKGCSIKRVQ